VEFRSRKPFRIHSVAITAGQKNEREPDLEILRRDMREAVIDPVFTDESVLALDPQTLIFVNPDGPFLGGPSHHSGLTGRKNAIDTYGEYCRQSGKALSGKDPLRIDRIGAYAARYAAKNVVAAGLASECEVMLSYTVGLMRPVSLQVQTFGTGKLPDDDIADLVGANFDFRRAGIVRAFNLRYLPSQNPEGFYQKLAAYGHVGRNDMDLPWEKVDKAALLASGG
jgi:S-adenosylmethionine synthetase